MRTARLLRLAPVHALRRLLAGSGPQLFDRATMPRHLEVLKRLIQQSAAYELRAGIDLYHDPMTLTPPVKRSRRSTEMARLVIELTNRCNLRCRHCFDERHAATGDLSLEIIDKVLQEGKDCGIDHLAFTGGEPTIHREFAEIIRRVCDAGYTFSFVSNGTNFPSVYPLLTPHRQWFTGATFSLDGAREDTHNRLRGKGSYRSVMQAASICVFKDLPFTFNMVLTAQNRHEVGEMVSLAKSLGSRGVRFGHLMPTPETAMRGLDLSPPERRAVEAEIWQLQKSADLPVGMAPGYFSESPFFPVLHWS